MARSLENKDNVEVPDTDYPYGRIKDDTGSDDGTPVDEPVYGDFHQFFARMFAISGLVYNELPDNDYSGFQYYEALITTIGFYVDPIKARNPNLLITKTVEIGDWDMNANSSKGVASGIDFTKIRSLTGYIRNDADDAYYPLGYADAAQAVQLSGGATGTGGNITLLRLTGGFFDSVNFDSTSYNRGWLTITYSP